MKVVFLGIRATIYTHNWKNLILARTGMQRPSSWRPSSAAAGLLPFDSRSLEAELRRSRRRRRSEELLVCLLKFAIIIGWSLGVSLSYFDSFIYNVGFLFRLLFVYSWVFEQFQFSKNPSHFFVCVCEKENISYPALLCIQMAMSLENEFVSSIVRIFHSLNFVFVFRFSVFNFILFTIHLHAASPGPAIR